MTADRRDSTPAPDAALPPTSEFIDIGGLPDVYAMAPLFADGATLVFDKLSPVRRGDEIIIWKRRELQRPGAAPAIVKRLHMDWPHMTYPYEPHPDSNAVPLIVVEQLNPRRLLSIPCEQIAAIHRCIGPVKRIRSGDAAFPRRAIERARKGGA